MSTFTRVLRLGALAILAGTGAADAAAQQGSAPAALAALRIRVTGELAPLAESGVLTFPGQGPNVVLEVVGTDAAGKAMNVTRFAPRWTTSDADVVSLYSAPNGPSMRIVAQQDGRATITVTAAGKTASLPVAVGKARLAIAASELTPAFRVARLELRELQPSGEGKLSGRALLLGENGDQTILGARAYAADGREIPLEHFPVTWTSSEATVAELFQTAEAQTRITGRASGRATVSASVQGTTVTLDAFVGDARAEAAGAVLAEPAVTTSGTTATTTATPTTSTATGTVTTTSIPVASGTPVYQSPTSGGAVTATTTQTPEVLAAADRNSAATVTLTAPTGLIVDSLGAGYYAFAWRPVAGAEYYELYVNHAQCANCRVSVEPITDTAHVLDQGRLDYTGSPPTVVVKAFANGGAVVSPASAPISVTPQRWKGYYRVVVAGFRVNAATLDDPSQIDGKWDEVFVRVASAVRDDITGQIADNPLMTTRVHGDVNATQWQGGPQTRVKAGSASTLGGLKAGDAFPVAQPWTASGAPSAFTFPLSIWEGWLHEGRQTLTVVPAIWEADRPPSYTEAPLVDVERPVMTAFGPIAYVRLKLDPQPGWNLQGAAAIKVPHVGRWGEAWAVGLGGRRGILPRRSILRGVIDPAQLRNRVQALGTDVDDYLDQVGIDAGGLDFGALQNLANTAYDSFVSTLQASLLTLLNYKDRPIGIVSGGLTSFKPHMVQIDFEFAESALRGSGPSGLAPGVIELRYVDAMTSGMGDYSLFLRIERLQ